MRAGCRFACFPSCRAALSLSLVRYCCSNDVIAAVPSVRCFLIVSASSSRHHACGHVLLASRPARLVEERGGATLRLLDVRLSSPACLPNAVSPSRAIWLGRSHLVPVAISCGLASPHVPTTGACDAVRSLCVLPVGTFQSFLKCCRVNLLKLCGSLVWLGSANTVGVAVPPRLFRVDCLRLPLLASLPARPIR